jgi:hypothetical protein
MNKQEIIAHCTVQWCVGMEANDEVLSSYRQAFVTQLESFEWPATQSDDNFQPDDAYDPYDFSFVPLELHRVGVHRFGDWLIVVVDNGMPPVGCIVHFAFRQVQ